MTAPDPTTTVCPSPSCDKLVDDHTVKELREHLSELYDHDHPYEETPGGAVQQELQVVHAGSLMVRAGSMTTSVAGVVPVLIFDFGTPDGPLAPIALILDDARMRSIRQVVSEAIDGALRAARKARK